MSLKTNSCNTIATRYSLKLAPSILEIKKKKAPVLWLLLQIGPLNIHKWKRHLIYNKVVVIER